MVTMYVDGTKIGTLAEADKLIPELLIRLKIVELRDEPSGRRIALITPEALCPWEPTLSHAEIQQRVNAGGMSLNDFRKQAGIA